MMRQLDGSTLEGGGQLVRIAVALSALTGQPLRISRIRGNRSGSKGLKASHCAAIKFLLDVCGGTAEGNQVGRHEMAFYPRGKQTGNDPQDEKDVDSDVRETTASLQQLSLSSMHDSPRVTVKPEYDIRLSTPGSIFLIFQALYPYLLFAGSALDTQEPLKEIQLHITGGTNVSFSPSYDYISQVLIPNFAKLGFPSLSIKLKKRGWASGRWTELGAVSFAISPLSVNGTTKSDTISSPSHDSGRAQAETAPVIFPSIDLEVFDKGIITQIDVTILAPDTLAQKLLKEMSTKSAKGRNRDEKLQKKAVSYYDAYGRQNPNGDQDEEGEEGDEGKEAGYQSYIMDDACNMKQGPPQTARDFLQLQTIRTLSKELTRRAGEQGVPATQGIGAREDEVQSHIDDVVINLHTSEATSHYSQTYILLVAHTSTGFRLGRDALYSSFSEPSGKNKPKDGKCGKGSKSSKESDNILLRMERMVDQCVTDLMGEFQDHPGDQGQGRRMVLPKKAVDVYMRDQIVVFEALGKLAHPRPSIDKGGERDEEGLSLHTRTAMWVCEQMLGNR
ncbi:hypothetical protein FQN49_000329 [Arthroderma sp. PD_2]|nr:hypothetical protein FQN49_000329 [Arthroderma sp. PD_2]